MLNTTTDHYQYASQIAPVVAFTDYSDGQGAIFNDEIQPHEYALVDCQLSTETRGVRTQPQTSWFIRRLYGKDLWCASWLDALCEIDERFLLHLCDQKQSYIHYLCQLLLWCVYICVWERQLFLYGDMYGKRGCFKIFDWAGDPIFEDWNLLLFWRNFKKLTGLNCLSSMPNYTHILPDLSTKTNLNILCKWLFFMVFYIIFEYV